MQKSVSCRRSAVAAITMALSLACSLAVQAQQAQQAQQAPQAQKTPVDIKALLPDPTHRAIFCGTDGGDASRAYSEAVSRAITALIDRGAATNPAQSIDLLKKALCQSAPK
jgi:hypothetical protein